MASEVRERLAPSVFRLPVGKIRDGYYSDAYFKATKSLLEADDHHPRVLMQVFQRHESILGGVDEAIAILKECSGRRGPDGTWIEGWDQLEVRALHEGDPISPWEPVLTIEGDYSLFAHLETVYLGCMAASRSCSSRRATTTGSCRPATAGRRTSRARSASPPTRRRRGGAAAGSGPCRTA
jgi:nicotinate phosphoribosyltransferase